MARRKRQAPDYTTGVWEKLRQQHIKTIERQIDRLEKLKLLDVSNLKGVNRKSLLGMSLQEVNNILNNSDYRKLTSSTVRTRVSERAGMLREFQSAPTTSTNSHDRFSQIMDQTSKADRDTIRELDSDDVFRIGEQLLQEEDKMTDLWTYDDFKSHIQEYDDIGSVMSAMSEGTFNNIISDDIMDAIF